MLLGTIVNAIAICIGAFIGRWLRRMEEKMNQTVMQGIALVIVIIGMTMALETDQILLVLLSIVLGGVIGSLLKIEERLEYWSKMLEQKFGGESQFANSFVAGMLVFCVGPMAILGGLDSGLRNHHDILFTKSILDGFIAAIFSSTLGIGVIFSAIPVFLYQGLIALSASWITQFFSQAALDQMIQQITAVGGILIIAIGCNLLRITSIPVANLLPALLLAAIGAPFIQY
ncbi:DUF554 domain-containing protein [Paenactinomyces guangxiensis]|nr:DUF554 domain-containing protein [Paenactinomyces guangxiensis]MBH8591155.1 DUF554 domain-containing protein [Paenactinomyces guangxiensis]